MTFRHKHRLLGAGILFVLLLIPIALYSKSLVERPHGDKSKLLKGCGSCHKGHGIFNTPMLPETKELFCFSCHGDSFNVEITRKKGKLAKDTKAANIQREFEKPYRHPIETAGIHVYNEILPEIDSSKPRHVSCVDCHHYHYVREENKMAGIRGTNGQGVRSGNVISEYELCFNCHSYSANLPADQSNKAEKFDIANPSYHPVIAPGRNTDVPSLMPPLTVSSLIKCTDCHNNDDPLGPKGPHGSQYRYMLTKNFTQIDGPEDVFQYELCYSCHRRSSILGNEGFQFHSLHIISVRTSCRTCHNPHGSKEHPHLIDLNNTSIMPSSSGQLTFIDFGSMAGQCFLNCHGKDHNPAVYPSGLISSSSL